MFHKFPLAAATHTGTRSTVVPGALTRTLFLSPQSTSDVKSGSLIVDRSGMGHVDSGRFPSLALFLIMESPYLKQEGG